MVIDTEILRLSIREHRGNLSAIARAFNIPRTQIYNRVESNAELKAMCLEARDEVIDKAEENIFNAVDSGDLLVSQFVLATIGKERGYSRSTVVQGDERFPIGPTTVIIEGVRAPNSIRDITPHSALEHSGSASHSDS